VAVRNAAVQTLEGRTVVFVQNEEGFEPRPVRLARADSEYSEVAEGLSDGESYAAKNSFVLKAEIGKGEAEHGH
jgi:cobalt-zinc-cadmium efflux system membrane fusion protein